MALLTTYFPVHERYSGIGFGYALGGALLGGTTPLIIASLVNWSGSSLMPAYYLMFSGLIGIISILWASKDARKAMKTWRWTSSPILRDFKEESMTNG